MAHPDPRWCALIHSSAAAREPVRPAVDRADYDPHYDPSRPIECECCGSTMFYTAACKIQCPNCGYQRDCSDP
jgi:hypothetical protein